MSAAALAIVPAADRPRGRIKRHWTAEEMRVLVTHYLTEGAAGCAARLPGRLPRHIHTKAISMGLRRQKAHAATRESTTLQRCPECPKPPLSGSAPAHRQGSDSTAAKLTSGASTMTDPRRYAEAALCAAGAATP